jgi:hypothetical protein
MKYLTGCSSLNFNIENREIFQERLALFSRDALPPLRYDQGIGKFYRPKGWSNRATVLCHGLQDTFGVAIALVTETPGGRNRIVEDEPNAQSGDLR